MLNNPKPYYALLALVLVFIFLWFFYGDGDYQFIGIEPLKSENIVDYPISEEELHVRTIPKKSEHVADEGDLSMMENEICVDITPEIPPEFSGKVCISTNTNHKFESKGEKICRDTMEKIYGVNFKNQRPAWLKNHLTNRNMELDCYNEQLKLAVEYMGEMHYKWPNYLNQSYETFKDQARRDKLKKELCEERGVHLIVVPYTVPFNLIPTFLMYHLPEIIQQRLKNDEILKQ